MKNIAKGTANPGVDFFCFLECFNYISAIQLKFNFVRFGLVGLVWQVGFARFGWVNLA